MKTIFEKSNGVEGIGFGECKLGDYLPQALLRKEAVGLPQLSELEVMRHYKELSDRILYREGLLPSWVLYYEI